jgi:hypothetical protein
MIAVLCGVLAACASTHDLNEGPGTFGGGVNHRQVAPGLYWVEARTNFKPWSNYSGASRMWRRVASDLCGKSTYEELNIEEAAEETAPAVMGALKYIVTSRKGYALCGTAHMGKNEAAALMEKDRGRLRSAR